MGELTGATGSPPGYHYNNIYFDRRDVQDILHVPHRQWSLCPKPGVSPFANGKDGSDVSGNTIYGSVIEQSVRSVIAHGMLDFVLLSAGSRLAIQ